MSTTVDKVEEAHPRATTRSTAWLVAVVAAIILVADQLAKAFVIANVGIGNAISPIPALDGILTIVPGVNTGTACGYLPRLGSLFTFAPFLILAIVLIFYRQQQRQDWLLSLSVGLIVGGAFGNLVDRLRFGYVVDFIQVASWPVFNIADAAVSTAVVLLLFWSLREETTTSKTSATTPARGASWKLALSFIGIFGVLAVAAFFVCVVLPPFVAR